MVGEALMDFGSLIARRMIAFPSPQSSRGQVVVFNYQKWFVWVEFGGTAVDIMVGRVGETAKRTWLAKRCGYD